MMEEEDRICRTGVKVCQGTVATTKPVTATMDAEAIVLVKQALGDSLKVGDSAVIEQQVCYIVICIISLAEPWIQISDQAAGIVVKCRCDITTIGRVQRSKVDCVVCKRPMSDTSSASTGWKVHVLEGEPCTASIGNISSVAAH